MINDAQQAEAILREGNADMILLARELLRDPYWPYHAAQKLGVETPQKILPIQYAHSLKRP